MQVKTRMICPKSWKILFLLTEHNINFHQSNITLNDEILMNINHPTIDNKNELDFIFSNLNTFINIDNMGVFGSIINEIEEFFIHNIVLPIRFERVIKPLVYRELSDISKLNEYRDLLKNNLELYANKLEKFDWFEQEIFGYPDISFSSAIAVLDYLGEIPWANPNIQPIYHWYLKIKSKNSFKIILNESCPGLKPHFNFDKIDF